MAKAKKSEDKKSTKESDNKVEARPIGEGKDPLAEGERLHNPTNTEAETHYDADRSELDDEERASKIRGMNANERAEVHNQESSNAKMATVPNEDSEAQEEVAAERSGR